MRPIKIPSRYVPTAGSGFLESSSPIPRKNSRDELAGPVPLMMTAFGTNLPISRRLPIDFDSRSALSIAVTATATDWIDSARRSAVTMTSSISSESTDEYSSAIVLHIKRDVTKKEIMIFIIVLAFLELLRRALTISLKLQLRRFKTLNLMI